MRTFEARTKEKYIKNRRRLVVAIGASGLAVALGSSAQPMGKVWRIGFLAFTGSDESVEAFREQLRKLGYVEGGNIAIEYRSAAGNEERVPALAAELVHLRMDVIVTRATFVALAVKRETSTIPIVMASASDPVGAGLIGSLSHPGGNVTGVTLNSTEIVGKRLQLLRELVSNAKRVAALVWEKSPVKQSFLEEIRATARQLGITLIHQEVGTTEALVGAFDVMQRERAQALIVQASPFATNNRKRIAELAAQQRLPTMFESRAFMDEGGFVSYGPDAIELHRRAAYYVDRILKGAKPADLPVEQPTKYELIINGKTAKALGIKIPDSILLRADKVIE